MANDFPQPKNWQERITVNPAQMGGNPCVRGMRITVGAVLGCLSGGHSREKVLEMYPLLEREDLDAVLAYAAWLVNETKEPAPLAS